MKRGKVVLERFTYVNHSRLGDKRGHRGVSGVRRLSLGAGHGHGVEVGWFGVEWGDERR